MKRLFGRLRPGFVLPSRRRLAGPLLDSVYERERNKTIGMLEAKPFVALVTDGWADPNNQSIVNFVLCTPYNSPVFWASIATGDNRHTAEYMAQQIEKVITDIEATIGAGKMSSIVTDNASNMKAAWDLLKQNRSELFCNGCGAHMLNLLIKDVFKIAFFAAVLEKARFMAKYIRKRYVLLDRFRDKQKKVNSSKERRRGLCIPVATRWYSAEACIRSIVENKIFLQAVFEDEDLQKMFKTREQKCKLQKAKDLLSDASFWVDAGVVLQLIHPINEALAAFESDLTWVSAVYDEFNKLERNKAYVNELDGSVNLRDIQREILELIVSRRKLLVSPSMRIGYLLDHRMSPKGFAENEQNTSITEAFRIARLHSIGDENDVRAFRSEVTRFVRFKYEFAQTYNDGDVTLSPWE
ncbi:hypothetical protein BBJ28_00016002 [Nothophytophthora sp. Chile5]|nr:hypothetical protein BBJ28_00016002 [Nothophytophthora sp. Chile5]